MERRTKYPQGEPLPGKTEEAAPCQQVSTCICEDAEVPMRVLHYGLGPIGLGIVRALSGRDDTTTVAAVDPDPQKCGQSLRSLLGGNGPHTRVRATLREAVQDAEADVAVHCAGSRLSEVESQLLDLMRNRLDIVSTAEELCYPWRRHPEEAARVHAAALFHGVSVLSTGVNPGLVLDLLPIILSGAVDALERIQGERIVDALTRREPLQRKIGAGLRPDEFRKLAREGEAGHVGLIESAAMVADALGWQVERIVERLRPKIARTRIETSWTVVQPGQVAGIVQDAQAIVSGKPAIALHLEIYLGAPRPRDRIVLIGNPKVEIVSRGGIAGDEATVAAVVNALPAVYAAPPGLWTVRDMPCLRASGPTRPASQTI